MTKHTPGPWTIERPRRANTIHVLHGEPPPPEHEWQQGRCDWNSATNSDILDHRVVSLSWAREDGPTLEEQEANATLIAAAPDLLAALVALETLADLDTPPAHLTARLRDALVQAYEAIAKAEGGG